MIEQMDLSKATVVAERWEEGNLVLTLEGPLLEDGQAGEPESQRGGPDCQVCHPPPEPK